MPPRSKDAYHISPETEVQLERLVDRIEATSGAGLAADEWNEAIPVLDSAAVASTLPGGLTLDDLAGILRLAMLTECATQSYADAITDRADRFRAGWLARFIDRVWVPDEFMHHAPYKQMLLSMGFSEDELDRAVRETQEKEFVHYGGETPVHVTTFGMIQEYLTDHWHGLIAKLLQPAAPVAARMANSVKRRETLHTVWYRDMTALQIEAQPRLTSHLAWELSRFRMPGNSLVPELQNRAGVWLPLMGADMDRVMHDLIRLLSQTLEKPRLLGSMVMTFAAEQGAHIGPVSARQIDAAVNRLGGPGLGLIGEAVLQVAGLDYLYQKPAAGARTNAAAAASLRTLLRTWLAGEIQQRLGSITNRPMLEQSPV